MKLYITNRWHREAREWFAANIPNTKVEAWHTARATIPPSPPSDPCLHITFASDEDLKKFLVEFASVYYGWEFVDDSRTPTTGNGWSSSSW